MIKSWLYPGPVLSYIIGFLGLGFSMAGIPFYLQIVAVSASILILVITAGIKLEEYLKARHERFQREEIQGFKVFLQFADRHADQFGELDQEVIDALEEVHDDFSSR